jgi:hypothetical protein
LKPGPNHAFLLSEQECPYSAGFVIDSEAAMLRFYDREAYADEKGLGNFQIGGCMYGLRSPWHWHGFRDDRHSGKAQGDTPL